jgi:pimeloyl-ACP methyl ester carboxylesterase
MTIHLDQQTTLSNGFKLGYAEFGDSQGKPVLHFHGMPSSRTEGANPAFDGIASRLGARVLIVERPGIGLSDFWPYTIVGWADIAGEFADRLGLPRFAVMGFSSGGKYAAACAWKIPQRLTSACIISGNAPVEIPEVIQAMTGQDRLLYLLARRFNGLLRLLLAKIAADARKNPQSILSLFTQLSAPDQAQLQQDETKKFLQGIVANAFQSGVRGVAWDWRLEALPWGFPISEITMPVSLWHGEEDKLVPVTHGCYMSRTMPNCKAHFVPGEGHISLTARHYEKVLMEVLGV